MTWVVIRGPKSADVPEDMTGPFDSEEAAEAWAAANTGLGDRTVVADEAGTNFASEFPHITEITTVKLYRAS